MVMPHLQRMLFNHEGVFFCVECNASMMTQCEHVSRYCRRGNHGACTSPRCDCSHHLLHRFGP
jgi:hypothetical protein